MLIREPQIGSILESKGRSVQVTSWVQPRVARVTDLKKGNSFMLRLGDDSGWYKTYTEVTSTFNRKGNRHVQSTGQLLKKVMEQIQERKNAKVAKGINRNRGPRS